MICPSCHKFFFRYNHFAFCPKCGYQVRELDPSVLDTTPEPAPAVPPSAKSGRILICCLIAAIILTAAGTIPFMLKKQNDQQISCAENSQAETTMTVSETTTAPPETTTASTTTTETTTETMPDTTTQTTTDITTETTSKTTTSTTSTAKPTAKQTTTTTTAAIPPPVSTSQTITAPPPATAIVTQPAAPSPSDFYNQHTGMPVPANYTDPFCPPGIRVKTVKDKNAVSYSEAVDALSKLQPEMQYPECWNQAIESEFLPDGTSYYRYRFAWEAYPVPGASVQMPCSFDILVHRNTKNQQDYVQSIDYYFGNQDAYANHDGKVVWSYDDCMYVYDAVKMYAELLNYQPVEIGTDYALYALPNSSNGMLRISVNYNEQTQGCFLWIHRLNG